MGGLTGRNGDGYVSLSNISANQGDANTFLGTGERLLRSYGRRL